MLFLLLQVVAETFYALSSMNKIIKFFGGMSALVSTLSQDDRDNVQNENCLHSRGIHDALSEISPKAASFIAKKVGGTVEKFLHDNKFSELPAEKLEDVFDGFEASRIAFIHNECMISMVECDKRKDITKLEDHIINDGEKGSIFCSRARYLPDISVKLARQNGFILPEDIDEKLKNNEKLKIRPLMIHCYGVSSSNTAAQLTTAVCNAFGIKTGVAENAVEIVKQFIEQENKKNKDENIVIIPYITGFSLGGMFAGTIATKLNYGSCLFNPWGMGSNLCKFVGEDAWNLANEQKDQHLIFSTEFDFTSSSASPLSSFAKSPGRKIIMENIGLGDDFHPVETHTKYRDVFQHYINRKQRKTSSGNKAKPIDKKHKFDCLVSLILHTVSTGIRYVCLTCMYVILLLLLCARSINNPILYF